MKRLIGLLALAAASCSSPNPRLYTLSVIPGASETSGPPVVVVHDIGLARYLERTQIVRSSEDFRLDVQANDWWGEPLGSMLSRVLVAELGQRLPGSVVYGENGALTTPPDASIEVNIQRMDQGADGAVVLVAQVGVRRRGGPPLTRNFRFSVTPGGPGIASEVAAMSAAVGQLADGLAAMLHQV
jgi:uncharacterized lipoprotein YmbA